jgi:hypothetical protein
MRVDIGRASASSAAAMVELPPPGAQRDPSEARRWWETRWFVAALILVSVVPLLYPQVPPLVDLFGHMGRYRVQLELDSSQFLQQYYGFEWAAIGNLGVDLLIMPLAPLIGLEPAVKLIVVAIPPMTVAGILWVAREVHNRLPPTALFALPFVYSHPFMFGFANYALSIALTFLAFGLWLRLGRLEKLRLRAALFVPISVVVFFAHTYGWGVLGLLCFSAEAVRQHDRGESWFRSGLNAALHASVMALPLIIMVAWRSETHGGMTRGWFDWELKLRWLEQALRDRWRWFDIGSLVLVGLVLAFALFNRRLTFSRNLLFSAFVLLVGFIVIPRTVFGSTYADMRLLPYMIAVLVLAIRFRTDMHLPTARLLAVLGLAFYLVRIAGHTVSLAIAADDQAEKLQALDHVPIGARVVSLVGEPCSRAWPLPRDSHLGAMVIVRRHGFSNDQWVMEGMNLLELEFREAGIFASDPSQIVMSDACGERRWTINVALRRLPREPFDYLWLVEPPPFDPKLVEGMRLIWRDSGSSLYRIKPDDAAPPAERLQTGMERGRPSAPPKRRSTEEVR